MCYLKKFKTIQTLPAAKSPIPEAGDDYTFDNMSFLDIPENAYFDDLQTSNYEKKMADKQLLMSLFRKIEENSVLMNTLNNTVDHNLEVLEQLQSELIPKQETIICNSENKMEQESEPQTQEEAVDQAIQPNSLIETIFGKKSYQYKLELKSSTSVDWTIYKERNIGFEVELTNPDGHVVKNSNIINLCLGVCDRSGEWIAATRSGDNFMKGKTETELYHGESGFSKIYPRDISRGYLDGKVSFVIYPKPSMLAYNLAADDCQAERSISFEDIRPLLIPDITIKAKRKN